MAIALDQQVPTDQFGQTGTMFQPIMAVYGLAWGNVGAREEITDFFEGRTVLQGYAHQAGDDVVEGDSLRGTVRAFDSKEDLGWGRIVVYGDMERSLIRNPDLSGNVVATGRERTTRRRLSYTI